MEVRAGTGAETREGCCLLDYSSHFLINPRSTSLGGDTTHSGLDPCTWIISQGNVPRTYLHSSPMEAIPYIGFPLRRLFYLCQVEKNNKQTNKHKQYSWDASSFSKMIAIKMEDLRVTPLHPPTLIKNPGLVVGVLIIPVLGI